MEWSKICAGIYQTPNVAVAVMKQSARMPLRAFGVRAREIFLAATVRIWMAGSGTNAMEMVEFVRHQSDPLQTYRDWFALLKPWALRLTHVGASESHEVDWKTDAQGGLREVRDQDAGKSTWRAGCRSFSRKGGR